VTPYARSVADGVRGGCAGADGGATCGGDGRPPRGGDKGQGCGAALPLDDVLTAPQASTFEVVPTSPALATARLGLAGAHQVQNASLAVALVKEFVRATTGRPLDAASEPALSDGLAAAKWPGRCQTVQDPAHSSTRWFLDGAHTLESLDCCAAWFFSPGVGLSSEPSAPFVPPRRPGHPRAHLRTPADGAGSAS
jgi:hypothetical protein